MKDKGGFTHGNNGHIAVCDEHQITVAPGLSNQAPDSEYFVPMLDRVLTGCGRIPEAALADAGFFSEANIRRAEDPASTSTSPRRAPRTGEKEPAADPTRETTSPCKAAMHSAPPERRYTDGAKQSSSRSSGS